MATTATENNLVLENTRKFWDKHKKKFIFGGIAVILICTSWIIYTQYKKSQDEKANEKMVFAERLYGVMANSSFNKDSVKIILEGGTFEGQKVDGLKKIIKEYGNTPSGDRARYIAGMSCLQIGDYKEALKYLKDFDGNGAKQVMNRYYLAMGHIYAHDDKKDDALKYYKKAAELNPDDNTLAPDAWMVYAKYAEYNNKTKEAIEAYKNIKSKYPDFVNITEVEKRLARLGEFD